MPPWSIQNFKNWVFFSQIAKIRKKFGNFFQHVKKLFNFGNFEKTKVAKSELNHLGFYCKLDFFDRKIRKVMNWNRKWVLIDGTPCKTIKWKCHTSVTWQLTWASCWKRNSISFGGTRSHCIIFGLEGTSCLEQPNISSLYS